MVLWQHGRGTITARCEHRRPFAKVIVRGERASFAFAALLILQPLTTRIEPDSETTAQFEHPRDIAGPGENIMVSMSRISVVARLVITSYPPTTSTQRFPGNSTAAHPSRCDYMFGPGANAIVPVPSTSVVARNGEPYPP